VLDEIATSPAAAALPRGDVVGRETAADDELGQDGDEIILIPVLVDVAEDEIEQTGFLPLPASPSPDREGVENSGKKGSFWASKGIVV
jgi:hypothetical protein